MLELNCLVLSNKNTTFSSDDVPGSVDHHHQNSLSDPLLSHCKSHLHRRATSTVIASSSLVPWPASTKLSSSHSRSPQAAPHTISIGANYSQRC